MVATVSEIHLAAALASFGVASDEVVGLAEVALRFNVTKRTAIRYTQREDFPAPLARLTSGPVWRRVDAERWGKEHLPFRRGRPPKGG
jgi:hypothetical protein